MKDLRPLDDLELYDLFCLCYPEKFPESKDEDARWDRVMEFIEEGMDGDGIADLLGRVVLLSNPMKSDLTDALYHSLGKIQMKNGNIHMLSIVRRSVDFDL